MTVSAVFFTTPLAAYAHESGRIYTANSSGLLTVAYPDGAPGAGNIASMLPLLYLTGTTTDRQTLNPSALNGFQAPPFGIAFDDTTLSAWCFYVGQPLSSLFWVNSAGTAV